MFYIVILSLEETVKFIGKKATQCYDFQNKLLSSQIVIFT